MRFRAKIDANHREIVDALRQAGCSVQSLAGVGKGCPDLLVGRRGENLLLEVKDGKKPRSARQLSQDERCWHAGWLGRVHIVESAEEALKLIL